MASIIKRTEDVAKACAEALEWTKQYREDSVKEAIAELMAERKFSFRKLKRIQRYQAEEEALAVLKQPSGDFFWHGSRYDFLMRVGSAHERDIKRLKSMCLHAGVIRLDDEDFDLIRGFL